MRLAATAMLSRKIMHWPMGRIFSLAMSCLYLNSKRISDQFRTREKRKNIGNVAFSTEKFNFSSA